MLWRIEHRCYAFSNAGIVRMRCYSNEYSSIMHNHDGPGNFNIHPLFKGLGYTV
jgi:hypothetical protein